MEHGFSPVPHHGPEPIGGNAAADLVNSTPTETTKRTAGASTTDDKYDVPTDESEHVKKHIPTSKYKRSLNKMKKQSLTAVFNYSNVTLTSDMEELLNLGLKFAILPLKLDITQVLVDFKR